MIEGSDSIGGGVLMEGHDFDLVKASQYGYLERIRQLVETQKVDCCKGDEQNITPMHWAAINDRLDVVRYFIDRGADVNAIGGVLNATPLHWATKRGHLGMVMLLVKNHADIRLKDGEGLCALHQASQCGHWTICAYLTASGQDVDERDDNGMTPLMWACYNSFSQNPTQFFIANNAMLSSVDSRQGNTPLHFAVIAGNNVVIPKLLKAGARLDVTNAAGQTPLQCARQQQSSRLTIQHLETAGRARNNLIDRCFRSMRLNPIRAREAVRSSLPGICLAGFGYTAGVISGWLAMFAAWIAISFTLSYISVHMTSKDPGFRETTPYGLFLSVMVLMYFTWFGLFWPYVNSYTIMMPFFINTIALWYYTYKSVYSDPGFVKQDRKSRAKAIIEFAEQGQLEQGSLLCQTCMVKRPLRSKHCSMCDRCVGCMDHHCPWVNNCIGSGNHREFVLYLFWLLGMNIWYLYGVRTFYSAECLTIQEADPIMDKLSKYGVCSPWVFILTVQGAFYTVWVICLLLMQVYQAVFCAATTNERFNMFRYRHFQRKNGRNESPFNRGIIRNCASFFKCSCFGMVKYETYDWLHEYDITKFVDVEELASEAEVEANAAAHKRRRGHTHGGGGHHGHSHDDGGQDNVCKHGKVHTHSHGQSGGAAASPSNAAGSGGLGGLFGHLHSHDGQAPGAGSHSSRF
eukprot:scpid30645/ scgid11005/ Palmitoyltransferase ZDHHC17; Huntingtin yeast partner H; Huntingtin-interacting protein 14; Huntingtin-interacting protein 3; Huntingtin-interacting protein H; Putative MAPK-activating protein PM11; Putative NF-kappa-B-activating protein 205; Zinc finger DHHC domain-containing protein 17